MTYFYVASWLTFLYFFTRGLLKKGVEELQPDIDFIEESLRGEV